MTTEPSPRRAVLYKVAGSIAAALLYLTLAQKYPLSLIERMYDYLHVKYFSERCYATKF